MRREKLATDKRKECRRVVFQALSLDAWPADDIPPPLP